MIKLISISKSDKPNKKLKAVFNINDKEKNIYFGNTKYSDYTIHKDKKRKEAYIRRHEVNENWNNPLTSGSLSRWVLWQKPTLEEGIKYYKNKFNL